MTALSKIIGKRDAVASERDGLVHQAQALAADRMFHALPEVLEKIRTCEAKIEAFNSSISIIETN